MRTGTNPAKKGLPAYSPKRLGVALITYVPFLEGYFNESLEIFGYQLESLRASTEQEFDLLVFDNGSCQPVVDKLQAYYQKKWIDWLILSGHNVGKAGAWNWIFAAMPNELICYADSDVLFRSGWLEATLKVLEAFPQAGMIGAQPNFFDVMAGKGQAHHKLQEQEAYASVLYQPEKSIVEEYCLGIGASDELKEQFLETPLPAVKHNPTGTTAVLGASHMQFVIPREVARQAIPLPATKGLLRAETMSLDYEVDRLGYLHLSTTQSFVFHMGNTISQKLLEEVGKLPQVASASEATSRGGNRRQRRSLLQRTAISLARRPRMRRFFERLYDFFFRVLYSEGEKR
jgi:hypothetical protein